MTTLAAVPAVPAAPASSASRWTWIYRPRTDLLLALGWLPVWVAVHLLTGRSGAGADSALRDVVGWTLLLSLLHQPLTLLLVYGDGQQFSLRRRLFTWSPLVAVGLVTVAVGLDLWLVVPVAAVWNTVHTLQQRYGLCRIYARKAGYGAPRLDRALLFSWLAAAALLVAWTGTAADQVRRVALGGQTGAQVRQLTDLGGVAGWLLLPVGAVALVTLALTVRQDLAHAGRMSHPKQVYVGATLLLVVGIAVDPVAGLVAWVAAHSLEYLVIVSRTMESRYGRARVAVPLGRLAHHRLGRVGVLLGFFALVYGVDVQARQVLTSHTYLVVVYTLGLLHFWYDAFIWKMRRPQVAATFGIGVRPAT